MSSGTRHLLHGDGAEHEEESWWTSMSPMLAHGICMVIGWLFLINVGSLVARYLKKASSPFPEWFPLHIWLQSGGAFISLVGVAFIVGHISSEGSSHLGGFHQVLGAVIMLMLAFQIYLGTAAHYAWYEGKPTSPIDMWHWWLGRAALVAAMFECLLGVQLLVDEGADVGLNVWLSVSMAVALSFCMIAYFEIYYRSGGETTTTTTTSHVHAPVMEIEMQNLGPDSGDEHTGGKAIDAETSASVVRKSLRVKRMTDFQFVTLFGMTIGCLVLISAMGIFFNVEMPMHYDDDDGGA